MTCVPTAGVSCATTRTVPSLSSPPALTGFSTFAGIGGFEVGIRMAGANVQWVGCSENDPFASKFYRYHFSSHPNYGDITQIDPKTIPDFDLLTGGFPCQAFSPAGRRQGFQDDNGAVFFDLARLIAAKKPRYLFLENVKGLLGHDQGRSFREIIRTLAELGYSLEWNVCDSATFGIPQFRERVYIVGYLGDMPARKVFPLSRKNPGTASGTKIVPRYPVPVRDPRKRKVRNRNRRFKNPGEPFFTLTARDRHGVYDGKRIRMLTPLEYERLQGFPDHWTRHGKKPDGAVVEMSDFRRYTALGNAVTTHVVSAIAKRLFADFISSP